MSMRPTPRLSVEGTREILEEMARPPADTPERRATFERAQAWQDQLDRLFPSERKRVGEGVAEMSMEPPGVLSWEGTLEILDELENGPRDTPERRATLEGARKWRDKIEHYFREAAPETPAKQP